MWSRERSPGQTETLGPVKNTYIGRVWSVCSIWRSQLGRRRWSTSRPSQQESPLPGEGRSEPGQNRGLEAEELYPGAETDGAVRGGLNTETNYCQGGSHMFHRSQYGSDELLGMETKVSSVREWKYKKGIQEEKQKTIQALADSGATSSIISWDLAGKLNVQCMTKEKPHSKMEATTIWM